MRALQKHVTGEGTHFRIPWLQTPHIFDVRIRPRNISSNTGTKDLQVVTINLRVLSRPEEEFLPDIFSSLGLDYDERVLPSIGNEVLKAVVAQYNAESLITKREMVSAEVRAALTKRAAEFHIKLDDVAITDLKFGKEVRARSGVEARAGARAQGWSLERGVGEELRDRSESLRAAARAGLSWESGPLRRAAREARPACEARASSRARSPRAPLARRVLARRVLAYGVLARGVLALGVLVRRSLTRVRACALLVSVHCGDRVEAGGGAGG